MDKETARILILSLLERFEKKPNDVFVTSLEADALRNLLNVDEVTTGIATIPDVTHIPEVEDTPDIYFPSPEEIDKDHLMCLDFGTSFSKAFACTMDDPEDIPELFPLSFGKNELEKPRLLLPSELFIDDEILYLGVAARSQFDSVEAPQDRLIDSPKQFITLTRDVKDIHRRQLNRNQDPSQTLTQRDALVLYLAHLNLRAETALIEQGLGVNLKRRYAHPAWKEDYFQGNRQEMRRIIAEAIALARCCKEELRDKLPVNRARLILNKARNARDEDLPFLLIGDPVLEATAAGAGALIGTPERKRIPYVILDIGAGTTDVAGCICINNPAKNRVKVSEVRTAAGAINQAGNIIDNLLLKLIMEKSNLATGTPEYLGVQASLKRIIRSDKEILFEEGSISVALVTGDIIEIELNDLLNQPAIKNLFKKITDLVKAAAYCVAGDHDLVNITATGGGASLPVVRAFDGLSFKRRKKHIRLCLVDPMPEVLAHSYPQLRDSYPQIAVAIGGALPSLPEQISSINEGISDPGKMHLAPMYKS